MKKINFIPVILLAFIIVLSGCEYSRIETGDESSGTEIYETEPAETEPAHVCEFGEWTVTKEPTCTENGVRVRTCECGRSEEEEIVASHSYTETVILPTLTSGGYTKHICLVCGDSYNDTATASLTPSEGLEFMDNPSGDGVVVKGIGSFAGTDLVIPATDNGKNVTGIWLQAFYGNEILKSVTIPEGVTFIGNMAFDNCKNLETVSYPATLTEIGEYAFFGCEKLGFAVLPDALVTVGDCSYAMCTSMEYAVIPVSLKNIGDSAFSCCTSLKYVMYAGSESDWNGVDKPESWNYLCRYLEMHYAK